MKNPFVFFLLAAALIPMESGSPAAEPPRPAHLAETVSYERMADALHAVLRATHDTYLAERGEPAGPSGQIVAAGGADSEARPANHAEFLRLAGRRIATGGAEFSFALRSSWPIGAGSGPQTQFEAEALERLKQDPSRPLFADEVLGGRAYFTAVYPQTATAASCVECHNQHPNSPRRDFQPGGLMGALVIRIPREF